MNMKKERIKKVKKEKDNKQANKIHASIPLNHYMCETIAMKPPLDPN